MSKLSAERHTKPIELVGENGEVSKKDLKLVRQRFLNLHKLKMQRASEAIAPRQRIFLEILPLLFHVNHPVLPGYISSKVPAGIADYTPSKATISSAKKLGKGFVYSKRAKRLFAIESIFLMGSVGSIAYAKGSDMDLWLCHANNLSGKALSLLQEKATEIEQWAASLGLEVHFFLMNAQQFKDGVAAPLSTESSGSTQHHLLLEEFYRTSLYVAGRYPIWWLVPPSDEDNYETFVNKLIDNRFVDAGEVIDFGGLNKVPAEEFLGASFWHLYKAIDSPYKSLIKLMLMESYVAQYPHSNWAAVKMKSMLYQGVADANRLDPYLLVHDSIEEYLLKKGQDERLALMRYCFFSKLSEGGFEEKKINKSWRDDQISLLINRWSPLPDFLADAIAHRRWTIEEVKKENERLTTELKNSYRLLTEFASERVDKGPSKSEEMSLLGRKLNAAFEKRPSKLDRATIKSASIQHEDRVILRQEKQKNERLQWVLYRLDEGQIERFIYRSSSLIGLLAWCVDYRVIADKTKVALDPGDSHLSSREVIQTLKSVSVFFNSLPRKATDLTTYRYKPVVSNIMLVINSGLDSMSEYTEKGVNLTSERSDALSFGSQRRNLVQSIDILFRNSWNEVMVGRYEGAKGIMTCLCSMFDHKSVGGHQVLPSLACVSYNSPRAMSLAHRLQNLFLDLAAVFKTQSGMVSPRFVFQIGRAYCIMQFVNRKMTAQLVQANQLVDALSVPQVVYSPVTFDGFFDQRDVLPAIYQFNQMDKVQVFYTKESDQTTQLYILDEKGSLCMKQQDFENEEMLLEPLKRFLRSIHLLTDVEQAELSALDIEFSELKRVNGRWAAKVKKVGRTEGLPIQNIRIAYDALASEYTLNVDDQSFTSLNTLDDVVKKASGYVREHQEKQAKPANVVDLDLPLFDLGVEEGGVVQTLHYLKAKQRIELAFQ